MPAPSLGQGKGVASIHIVPASSVRPNTGRACQVICVSGIWRDDFYVVSGSPRGR